jgi:Tfp pilus assembly protein PilO
MSPAVYLTTLSLFFGTIVFVFSMKYFSAAFQSRARLANDEAYKSLAEKTLTAQSENQASLSAIQAELSRLTQSLGAVEKILKQVE